MLRLRDTELNMEDKNKTWEYEGKKWKRCACGKAILAEYDVCKLCAGNMPTAPKEGIKTPEIQLKNENRGMIQTCIRAASDCGIAKNIGELKTIADELLIFAKEKLSEK